MKHLLRTFLLLFYPERCIVCQDVLRNDSNTICLYCLNHVPKNIYDDGEVQF